MINGKQSSRAFNDVSGWLRVITKEFGGRIALHPHTH